MRGDVERNIRLITNLITPGFVAGYCEAATSKWIDSARCVSFHPRASAWRSSPLATWLLPKIVDDFVVGKRGNMKERDTRRHRRCLDRLALPIKILLSSKLNCYSNYCGARWRRRVTAIIMLKKYLFFFRFSSSSGNLYILRPVRDAHIKPLSVSLNTAVTYRS